MPTTYTPSLRLALPQQGTLDGMWGTVVNNGITALADAAIAGTATIAMSDADRTLTAANEAADEARSMALRITGTLTAQRAVICPAVSKLYLVENATTGGHGVNVRTPSGAGTVVAPGARVFLYCNGVAVVPATSADLTAIQNSTPQWLTGVTGTSTITANANPPITAYVVGQTFRFMWPHATASTGPLTLNINGLGARQIVLEGGGPVQLPPGAILPWAVVEIVFDGTVFQLTNSTIATQALRLHFLNISSQNLNTITQAGHYTGGDLINAPLTVPSWWYIEVIRHFDFAPGTQEWVMQRATGLSGAPQGRVFVRTSGAPANWTGWNEITAHAGALTTNGWYRLPNGLIMQWGRVSTTSGATAITFPVAFPSAAFMCVPQLNEQVGGALPTSTFASGLSPTGFTLFLGGFTGGTTTVSYLALGL